MSTSTRAVEFTVTGGVQGVNFRSGCAEEAERLGVTGWVANEPDGSVSGHAEGEPDAVESLVSWLHQGPSSAEVEDVTVRDVSPREPDGFETR